MQDGSGEDKTVAFATDTNIKMLCEANTTYIDGTFDTYPKLFYQIFSIEIIIEQSLKKHFDKRSICSRWLNYFNAIMELNVMLTTDDTRWAL